MASQQVGEGIEFSQSMLKGLTRRTNRFKWFKTESNEEIASFMSFWNCYDSPSPFLT